MKEPIVTALGDIEEIKDLLEYYVAESEWELSELELDLLKKKLVDVYEVVCKMKLSLDDRFDDRLNDKLNDTTSEQASKELIPQEEAKPAKPIVTENIEPAAPVSEAEEAPSDEQEEVAEAAPEAIVPETQVNEPEEATETSVPEAPKAEKKPATSPQIIGERYQSNGSLNEKMGLNGKKDVSSRLQASPIKNLSRSLGMNDRFIYIKELFKGNREQFKEAVEQLDNMASYQEAETYLNQFSWEKDNECAREFKEKVKRRYQ